MLLVLDQLTYLTNKEQSMTVPIKTIINLELGTQEIVELTPEEIIELEEQKAAWEASQAAIVPPTPEEKLASAGLTVDELKSLLGLS